ncbi:MAG: hypothetical protein RL432_140 [Bacteroidota bacterium]|jgi:serine/threonine protein phosphatase PrpC
MIQYKHYSKTDVGLVRSANEDGLGDARTPNGHVFTVCDGMGGHVGGATASKIAVQSILEYFNKQVYDNLMVAIDRALIFANEQIYAAAKNDPSLKGMGTTAVILIIYGDECYLGYVGDSRIYLKSEDQLYRLTKDHSFVQTLVDQGIIRDEDAENHPKKNQILKALGIGPLVEPTVASGPTSVKEGDVFMLCSDGLSGMVNDASMEMMVDYLNLEMSAQNLVNSALANGGHDNITVTLVGITNSPHKTSEFTHYNPKKIINDVIDNQAYIPKSPSKKNKNLILWIGLGLLLISSLLIAYLFWFKPPKNIVPPDYACEFCRNIEQQAPKMDSIQLADYLFKKVNTKSDTIECIKCSIVIKDSIFKQIIPLETPAKNPQSEESNPIQTEKKNQDKKQPVKEKAPVKEGQNSKAPVDTDKKTTTEQNEGQK